MKLQLLSTTATYFVLSSGRCNAQIIDDSSNVITTTVATSSLSSTTIISPTLPPAPAPEPEPTTSSSSSYTPEQCNSWTTTALAADTTNSNGLSQTEYLTFLQSMKPPYIGQYFASFASFSDLPFTAKIVNKIVSCACTSLPGYDANTCCSGSDAELPLAGFNSTTNNSTISEDELAYQTFFCETMGNLVSTVPVVPTMSPTLRPSISTAPPTITSSAAVSDAPTTSSSPTSSNIPSQSPTKPPSKNVIPPIIDPDDTEGGLSPGAWAGIILAILLAILVAILLIVYYRRKEEERLREFAGEGDEVGFVPVDDDYIEPQEEEEQQLHDEEEEGKDDASEASSEPSVWSESDEKEKSMDNADIGDEEEQKVTEGSDVAAMGVASTVVRQLSSSSKQNDV
mmetsp:Transcript_28166/g.56657  ORF Transcript_28166/g.56657 Transcript_28166/m.56657 type:complete len:398 (+) Transcript_28166:154-1347(+)